MSTVIGLIIGITISAVIAGLIILIVSKLKLGLTVDGFGWAMLAGLLIGVFTNLIMQVVPAGNQMANLVVNLIISSIVIFACGAMLKGMTVDGYRGALISAIAIAIVQFLLALAFVGGASLIGQTT